MDKIFKRSTCAAVCAGYFPLQPSACVVWATMDVLLCTASIWHMCTMSLDRYCTLRYPISYGRSRTRTSVALKIAFVWVVSTAVCAALAVIGFVDHSNVYVERQCVPAVKDFVLYGSILAFYVPLVIMVITYVMTVRILAENRRTMASIGLQSNAGGDRKAGNNGDWVTTTRKHRWDGPVASAVGNTPRPTDAPVTGRYRRKSTVPPPHSPGHAAAKPPALRRNRIDDQSVVSSSAAVTARRRHSDGNLAGPAATAPLDGRAGNDLAICRAFSSFHNFTLSQPSCRGHDSQLDTTQDDVPQPSWVVLSSPSVQSPLSDCSEQQWRQFLSRQRFKSKLKSDRLDAVASSRLTASSNIPASRSVENICSQRRRMSDSVLLDNGQTSAAKNQTLDEKICHDSMWSVLRRRRQRPSYVELDDTTTDLDATPRYLGVYITSAKLFPCGLDNAKRSFYRTMVVVQF